MAKEVKSNKKLIIILMIIIFLFSIFMFIRYFIIKNTNNLAANLIKPALLKTIYQVKDELQDTNNSATSLTNANEIINKNIIYLENQIENIKLTGYADFYINDRIITCNDGTVISPEQFYSGYMCIDGLIKTQENKGYKTTNIKTNFVNIMKIASNSMIITPQLYSSYIIQNIEENPTSETVFASSLDQLLIMQKFTIPWQVFQESFKELNISQNSNEIIIKFENINNNLETPSSEQIKNLKIADKCIEKINEFDQMNGGQLKKSNIIEKIFFLKKDPYKICIELKKNQINNLLKLLVQSKTTKNHFTGIYNKIILNSMIKCPDEIFIIDPNQQPTCTNNYANEVLNKIRGELKK